MKNKWYVILLVLLLTVILPATRPVFAAEENTCKPDQQDIIKQKLTDSLRTSFSNFQSAVGPYNSLARTYMANCLDTAGNPGPKVRISVDDAATAKAAGVNIENDDLYEYISIPWGNVRGTTTACVQLLQEVKAAYTPAIEAYNNMRGDIQALKNPSATRCDCNENGEVQQCYTYNKETGEVQGQDGKCESFTGIQQRLTACPLCGIFEAALNASARVAHVAWQSTAKPLSEVVIIFFLVLLAIESLKAVSATGGLKLGTYLRSVFTIGLKIAITVTLLSNSQYIYTLFISPVLRGGLDMGLAIASAGGNIQCDTNPGGFGVIASSELDETLFNQVLSTVRCFGATAATLPAVGMGLICHSAPSGMWSGDFLPDLHMFLSGLIMLAFGLMIWLALSFYLIDCTVQIGMLSALVPLLVACWPFDLTKQYTTKGVRMLMNTFFNFALMGTVLLVGTAIIAFAVSGDGSSSMQEILRAVNNNEADTLKKLASLDGIRVLMLLACCIFALKLIAKVSSLAHQFSQSSGTDIGSNMATAALGTATAVGQGGLHSLGKLGGYAGNAALDNTGLRAKFNELTDNISEAKHQGLQTFGRMVGLGRFQNQQTGSGLQAQTGEDMLLSEGSTSPQTNSAYSFEENALPENESPTKNTSDNEENSATEKNNQQPTENQANTNNGTPRSGREAASNSREAAPRSGSSGERLAPLANENATPTEDAQDEPLNEVAGEPVNTQQNDKETPKTQQKPDNRNKTTADAVTRQNNASEEGVAHNRMASNQNPINAEETANNPVEQAQPSNAEQTSRGAVSQNETVAESRQAEQNNRATGGATAGSTGATVGSAGSTGRTTGGATAGSTGATAGNTSREQPIKPDKK